MAETVRDLAAAGAAATAAKPDDRGAVEVRIVDKLHEAGQLRSGYLLRALREGKLSLFQAALAKLGALTLGEVRGASNSERPELLALACLSAGLDRSVFPTVLTLVRELNGGRPAGGPEGLQRAADMFGAYTAKTAATVLREAARG
jgi:uncharacterized protein (DUF2336 family)